MGISFTSDKRHPPYPVVAIWFGMEYYEGTAKRKKGVPVGLYKYVSSSVAKKILAGTIRFTQPSAFNDPFELLPQFITEEDLVADRQEFNFCVLTPRRKGLDRSHIRVAPGLRSDINARKIVGDLNAAIGILCLSRNADSLLMWGLYADDYSGALIEFDETHDFFTGMHPVKYKKRRPVFDLRDFHGKVVPISDLFVKPSVWAHEREVRIVRSTRDLKDTGAAIKNYPLLTMDIPRDCIKSVFLGDRMKLEDQVEIWSLIKDTNISLSLAAVDNWGYAFRYDPIKFSGPLIGSPMISPRTAHIFKDLPGEFQEVARWMIEQHPSSAFVNQKC
ncbi:DUF2971 domain-containing protein [Pseudomonas sp. P115]|uniref:DUF2971 domain-containing protein n=1 Tax=Pseudomonas pisciculturae TaxID=2730413 RepID=UPI0018923D72|nr:DUF2971 domain-containing protein [Pseudomonas pisciculturae]MBF6029623.1 DUF2971 domain-containing protein [Pseudomonas pisciculturae]